MEFQGFQHSFPLWLVVLAILGVLFLSWYAYRGKKQLPAPLRWLMSGLRASALLILLLLLLNPFFYESEEINQKPEILVFMDNSESVSVERGSYNGEESYRELLNALNFGNRNEYSFQFYETDSGSRPSHPDSLTFSAPVTNLYSSSEILLEKDDEPSAAILITDGIYTFGKDPVFTLSNAAIPVFTIALGDTTEVNDISVSNVLTNETGYTETRQNIEAEITQTGFEGSAVNVELIRNNEVLERKQLNFNAPSEVQTVEFETPLTEAGLQQYRIYAEPLNGEWSEDNNRTDFTINVLDSKTKIVHAAFTIHPDVKMLRSVIASDRNNELFSLTWSGSSFIEALPETEADLLIVHGSVPPGVNNSFLSNFGDVPTILISTGSNRRSGAPLRSWSLLNPTTNRLTPVSLRTDLDEGDQVIMELPDAVTTDFPPLYAPFRTSKTDEAARVLFTAGIEGLDSKNPLIAVSENTGLRRADIMAWGWNRIYRSNNPQHREYITSLFSNIVSWTSKDPDDRLLKLSPVRQSFTTGDRPLIQGSLENESGESEQSAVIEVTIRSSESNARSFNMEHKGNGNYQLLLPELSEGLYSYEAVARKGNRDIDRNAGEFLIADDNTEMARTRRNDELLNRIARNTGAEAFSFDNASGIWDAMETAGLNEARVVTQESYSFPVRQIHWFILVLVLLTTEWLLRKYYSLT